MYCSGIRVYGHDPQVGYNSRQAAVALRDFVNPLCLIVQCQSKYAYAYAF